MGKNSRKPQKTNSANPFYHQRTALELLEKQYPNTPMPVLLKAWQIWDHTRRMSEKDRKSIYKQIDDMPDRPRLDDFEDAVMEYKCVSIEEPKNSENESVPVFEIETGESDISVSGESLLESND